MFEVRPLSFAVLTLCITYVGQSLEAEEIKFPSPDGRFALRITELKENERGNEPEDSKLDLRVELIEKASGKVMVKLGRADSNYLSETVLVWSADSNRAAYATRRCPNRIEEGETRVYFWNGTTFAEIPLPADMPAPDITFPKGTEGSVKPYGGGVKPLRWLKSGELELSSDDMMLSRVNGRSYTGVVRFAIAFDAQHHASVSKVGKTKTKMDE